MDIGKAITYYRVYKGWNKVKMSKLLKHHDTYLSQVENRNINLYVITLLEICKVLGIKLSELILKAEEYE